MNTAAAEAVREALELLGRASQDWRNGTADVPGALHWPVAIHHARKRLQDALEALDDAHAGMAWFNGLTPTARGHWLRVAGSARPVDAWRAFRAGGPQL